jgi:hypothetical protein
MRRLVLGMLLLLPLPACGGHTRDSSEPAEDAWVESAMRPVCSGVVTRLEILYLPKEIMTIANLRPEQLEKGCYYRISIEQFQASRLREDLISALRSSAIRKVSDEGDLRWGCIFYNGQHRVLTMYFDRFGKGLIGGTRIASNGRFVEFLSRRFSCVWEGDYRP